MKQWLFLICFLTVSAVSAAAPAIVDSGFPAEFRTAARWIWYPEKFFPDGINQTRYFRKRLDLKQLPVKAVVYGRADDALKIFINGKEIPAKKISGAGHDSLWRHAQQFDAASELKSGANVIAAAVRNGTMSAGVILRVELVMPDNKVIEIVTDGSWKSSRTAPEKWNTAGFDDSSWSASREIGDAAAAPWGGAGYSAFLIASERSAFEKEQILRKKRHQEILAKLAAERKITPQIRYENGSPMIFFGSQAYVPYLYKSLTLSIDDHKTIRKLEAFRDAGSHLYTVDMIFRHGVWQPGNRAQLPDLEYRMLRILEIDPQARFLVGLALEPPRWYIKNNPDELIGYANGKSPDADASIFKNVAMPSFASEKFRKDCGAVISDAVRQLEASPLGKRICAYMPHYGIYTEWHYYGMEQSMPDTGKAMTKAFRNYLKKVYNNDVAALRKAWNNDSVTFENAQVPGAAERAARDTGMFRSPVKNRQTIDYFRCHGQELIACQEYFNKLCRQAAGNQVLTGNYYGYFFGMGYPIEGWHTETERVLDSAWSDFNVAPYPYIRAVRGFGGAGISRSVTESYRLRGNKFLIAEDDSRTHLNETNPGQNYCKTVSDSLAILTRTLANNLSRGLGTWYLDFGMNWYDHPEIFDFFKKAGWIQNLQMDFSSAAEVALVVDFDSMMYTQNSDRSNALSHVLEMGTSEALFHSGAPFDTLLFGDLKNPRVRDYKVYIFANIFYVNPERMAMIEKLKRDGKVLVFTYAPGFVTDQGCSVESMSKVTGMKMQMEKTAFKLKVNYTDAKRVASLKKALMPNRNAYQVTVNPVFHVTDPAAESWGTFQSGGKTLTGLAMKKFPSHTVIYSLPAAMDDVFLKQIFWMAGVHMYSGACQNVFYVNKSLIGVHTEKGGKNNFSLPRKAAKVIQLLPEFRIVAENTDKFSVELSPRSTAIFMMSW